jgi:hypothetical protein
MPKDTTPSTNPVSLNPVVSPAKNELVSIIVDKDMTDGGIRINGKLYVGNVKVTQEQAEDLMRIQEEYFETKKKLTDPNVHVRMKSDFQKEKLFLADPRENENKKGFTRDYGLLGAREWSYCSPKFKEHLLNMRRQLYGY